MPNVDQGRNKRTVAIALSGGSDTRAKLINGTIATLRSHGIAGVSARTIAKTAGVNQALVFYHFKSVNDLIDQACRESTALRVELYRAQFAEVASLKDLLAIGQRIHDVEWKAGNVTVLAQVLAGAQQDAQLATTAREALGIWIEELHQVIDRVIDESVLAGLIETAPLAEALAASFIGMELYEGIGSAKTSSVFDALEPFAAIADLVDNLGAVPRKAVRASIRRSMRKAESTKQNTGSKK